MARRPAFLWIALLVLTLCHCGRPDAALQRTAVEAPANAAPNQASPALGAAEIAFLDTLEARTFQFFWDCSDPRSGLTPDRWPTQSFASVSATGFALTAYPIGVERGYVSRGQARSRVLNTLRFFWTAPQDTARTGVLGYRGFFYHFVDPATGHRFETVELSTVDTALFLAGALFCQSYFDGPEATEVAIRAITDSLVGRADWQWAQVRPPAIGHGWSPEQGALPYDWRGYNEATLLYLLALGSPTHPVGIDAWHEYTSRYKWGTFEGQEHVGFAPLFGHQYSHAWIDFRGIQDEFMRGRGIDYFENSRRATLAQRAYGLANPGKWVGYGPKLWGLTACDGPLDGTLTIAGRAREFHTYWARGASFTEVHDDGTVSPAAAGGSIPFAPEVTIPVLMAMRATYGEHVFGKYGFVDALNPTIVDPTATHHGQVVKGLGWFDIDYLGIDQGPILIMAENYRTGLVWRTMQRNPHIVRGLRAAGFTGGWLDTAPEKR